MLTHTDDLPLLPGYRLLERLGRGGFGEVWKCEAPGGLFKAVKFVHGTLGDDADPAAAQEFKALQRIKGLRHPFLLSLERVDVVDGQLVIVMELADRNLMDRFEECKQQGLSGIPRTELFRYMEETAEALDLMNIEHQLQHLDIKPQNIFLVRNHVKVADFGLAKDLEGTQASLSSGITPVYAAPETFEGVVSRFCDQYSFAILYQEMLTGRRPFNGTNARQLLLQHMAALPDLSPLPEGDRAAVARALAKKPGERFPSCLEFVRALGPASGKARPVFTSPPASTVPEAPLTPAPSATPSLGVSLEATPRTVSAVEREEESGPLCSNCGAKKPARLALNVCLKCGYSEERERIAAAKAPRPVEAALDKGVVSRWIYVLLAGIILIGALATGSHFIFPRNTEGRALWGVAVLGIGVVGLLASQVWTWLRVSAAEKQLGPILSLQVWVLAARHFPLTRWPISVLVWALLVIVSGFCLADFTYWSRYHAPKTADDSLRRALAQSQEAGRREERALVKTLDTIAAKRPPASAAPTADTPATADCVVVGYIPNAEGTGFAGVLLATVRDGKLVPLGVVERGFSPEERSSLFDVFQRNEHPVAPRWWSGLVPDNVVWLKTSEGNAVLCEVEGQGKDERTGNPRDPQYRGRLKD